MLSIYINIKIESGTAELLIHKKKKPTIVLADKRKDEGPVDQTHDTTIAALYGRS